MRDYGRVFSAIWASEDFRALTEDGRALVLYLLTCQHGTLAGVFRMPDGYVAEDLQWPSERVAEGFRNIAIKGFATRCESTKWVWISKYLEWNPLENPNQRKAAAKLAESVPVGCSWRRAFGRVCGPSIGLDPEPFANPLPTLPESVLGTGVVTGTGEGTGAGAIAPSALSGKAPRKAREAKPAPPSAEVWSAYANAYQGRYQVQPVRNASVNAHLAQFVGRVGADEAPAVAAHFVQSQNGLYVAAMHPTNLLLRDAEKLRTEWATGRMVTRTQAQQADRTQTNANAFAGLLARAEQEAIDAQH